MLSPGRGIRIREPSCFAAASRRSTGSAHEWSARLKVPQCTGIKTSAPTARSASRACSGPRCTSAQVAS